MYSNTPHGPPQAQPQAHLNGHDPTVKETARTLFARGIMPLPLGRATKDPHRTGWPDERYVPKDVDRQFHDGQGVGARWGYLTTADCTRVLTNNVVDVDLDCIEAVRIAPLYLPPTGMCWGRASKPRSHWIYQLTTLNFKATHSWSDMTPDEEGHKTNHKLLVFHTNKHSVAPGSINVASGRPELVRWEPDGDGPPAVVAPDALTSVLPVIGAGALVARHWREGDRNETVLPLAGFLWHGGMPLPDALRFVEAVCLGAQDEQVAERLRRVEDTYRKAEAGEPIWGGPTLEDHLHPIAVGLLRKWLRLRSQRYVGLLGPDGLPLAGDGDGERFSTMWVGQVLYCAAEDTWYVYDGTRWKADEVKDIRERAKAVVVEFRRVLGERSTLCGQNGIAAYKDCADYAKNLGNAGAISAMLVSAQSKPELRVAPEEFDSNPLLFNVLDCTVELDVATGQVNSHLHDPADKLRQRAAVHFYPDATHWLLTQHKERFFPEDDRWMHLGELAGYALTGLPKRHATEFVGPHDAGKSGTLKLFAATWGDYAASLAATNLTKNPHKGGDVGRPDLWRVKHKRLVVVTEVHPDDHFDLDLFKALTSGGDPYALRTFFDKTGGIDAVFRFALWMSGNNPYGPPPNEEAAYARLEVMDCTHVIPEPARNVHDELALTTDQDVLDAAFAFAVAGFQRLYGVKRGVFTPPESSVQRKVRLRDELDEWAPLLDELVEVTGDPNDGVMKSELNSAAKFTLHAQDAHAKFGYKQQEKFEAAVERRGGVLVQAATRFANCLYWRGVRWTPAARAANQVTLPNWQAKEQ